MEKLRLIAEDAGKALEMTDDRNLTSHTYHENVAEEIYSKIKDYYKFMNKVYQDMMEML